MDLESRLGLADFLEQRETGAACGRGSSSHFCLHAGFLRPGALRLTFRPGPHLAIGPSLFPVLLRPTPKSTEASLWGTLEWSLGL